MRPNDEDVQNSVAHGRRTHRAGEERNKTVSRDFDRRRVANCSSDRELNHNQCHYSRVHGPLALDLTPEAFSSGECLVGQRALPIVWTQLQPDRVERPLRCVNTVRATHPLGKVAAARLFLRFQ